MQFSHKANTKTLGGYILWSNSVEESTVAVVYSGKVLFLEVAFSCVDQIFLNRFYFILLYFIRHCFICRPSDSTVSEDAGIEHRAVATLDLGQDKVQRTHDTNTLPSQHGDWSSNTNCLYTSYLLANTVFAGHLALCFLTVFFVKILNLSPWKKSILSSGTTYERAQMRTAADTKHIRAAHARAQLYTWTILTHI